MCDANMVSLPALPESLAHHPPLPLLHPPSQQCSNVLLHERWLILQVGKLDCSHACNEDELVCLQPQETTMQYT